MGKGSPTILCAVAHAYQAPWIEIWTKGQCLTWQTIPDSEHFQTINYFGIKANRIITIFDRWHEKLRWANKYTAAVLAFFDEILLWPFKSYCPSFLPINNLNMNHKVFEVKFPDTYLTCRWKLFSLLRYFLLETSHDYLYITTSSSYVRQDVLLSRINSLPRSKVYFGAIAYQGADFVSGSSRLLSRDTAELVWKNRSKFSIGIIEDKALGQLLRKLDVEPEFIPIHNLNSFEQISDLKISDLEGTFHFRVKSEMNGVRIDASLMKALHAKIRSLD